MSDYAENLKGLTINELLRAYASQCDAMQGLAQAIHSSTRQLHLSKLILINNEIREREELNAN